MFVTNIINIEKMDGISMNEPVKRSNQSVCWPPLSSSLKNVLEDGSDRNLRRVIHNLFSVGSILEELRSIMGMHIGLTGGQYQILMVIARLQNGHGIAIKNVATQLRVVASHVTVELGKLAKWGFVEKVRDVHDGRSILVALTKKGVSAIEAVTPVTQSVNDGLFDGFAKSDFQKLDGLLEHFVCNAENTLSTALYEKEMAERQTAGKR